MKRTAILITIGIILLAVTAVWLFQVNQKKKTTAWDLIGSDAVIVFELPNLKSLNQKLERLPMLKSVISSSDGIKRISNSALLSNNKIFISIHPTASDDFGYLVYAELNSGAANSYADGLKQSFQTDLKTKERLYNGVEIYELVKAEKPIFSYAVIDEVVMMSTSSYLLEGALRLRTSDGNDLFKRNNASLFKLPTLQSDEGNIYLNVSSLMESTKLFLQLRKNSAQFSLHGSSLADVKIDEDRVLMNGFTVGATDDILSLFENQQPQTIEVAQFVSNRVAATMHYGISDGEQWFKSQKQFLSNHNVKSTDSLEAELLRLSVDVESIRKSVGSQFANCYLNIEDGTVSILKLSDNKEKVSILDELSSKLSDQKRDSLYVEDYAGYQIRLIDYKNFLYQLLYPIAIPADQTFFVQIGQYVLLSENVELLKYFIDDMDAENTWGKSVDWNKFLSTSLQESNINLFFDGKLTSVFLRNQFNSKWKLFFDSTNFLGIDKGAAQLSKLESNFYLNASLQFAEAQEKKTTYLEKTTYDFGNKVIVRPTVVRSHVSKDIEVVMQDSLNNFYLLSKDLKVQFKEPIGARIVGDIEQLDFFANGKLQYFFTTGSSIHIIDRLGRYVEGYPKDISVQNGIEYSAVVDYDKSKRYRFLMTERKGNLLLTDKSGNLLTGWDPLALNGKMIVSARHYRILGKDYFIAVDQNGRVNLMNRRGEMVRGFPMDLGIRPMGDISVNIGNTLSTTDFTVISKEGLKIQFGLDGQISKKEVLLKRAATSQFELVRSNSEDAYVFIRTDLEKIGVLDKDGKILFEIENPGSTNWHLSFLESRLKERFYCLYDKQQNFSYYYNSNGELLLPQPLESTLPPAIYYDEKLKRLLIYNAFNSSISKVSIKK